MHLSLRWLKDYLSEDININPLELAERISVTLTEAEGVESFGDGLSKIVVGKITSQKPHPDSKKLKVVSVDIGTSRQRTIIHGANNVKKGDFVAVALPGGNVYNPNHPLGKQGLVDITSKKLGGVTSGGMICSLKELGLYDNHSEIYILPEDSVIGEDVVSMISDTLLEIENKHLTHRADCFSHKGIAREIAAMTNTPFRDDDHTEHIHPTQEMPISVKVENSTLCPRFTAVVVKGVTIKPSPLWLQLRLFSVGVRPINNIVDATNYVMLDKGQPLHAFDYDKIEGAELVIRTAKDKEKLTTLDGVERELTHEMVVVADAKRPVSLAGIMGGENSEIEEHTSDIILEAANWEMFNIRRTSRELGLRSDASTRFEKGQDPNQTLSALEQAVALVTQLAGGEVASDINDKYPKPVQPEILEFEVNTVKRLLGIELLKQEVIDILESLGMHIVEPEKSLSTITVEIPTFRNDITIKEDLIEEIGRIYGYDRLTPTLPERDLTPAPTNLQREFIRLLKEQISALGLSEIYTYSFIGEELYETALLSAENCLKLKNPVSPDLQYIRNSLVPSMIHKVSINLANYDRFGLFEISKTIHKELDNEKLPTERYELATMYVDKNADQTSCYRHIKSIFDNLTKSLKIDLNMTHVNNVKQSQYPAYLHPGRSGLITTSNGTEIGHIGILHPAVLKNASIKYPVALLVLNVANLLDEYNENNSQYTTIPTYQNILRDISILVDTRVEVGSMVDEIVRKDNTLISEVKVFDIYYDTKNKSKKSVSLHLSITPQEGNLTDEEIETIVENTITLLSKKFKATLRK